MIKFMNKRNERIPRIARRFEGTNLGNELYRGIVKNIKDFIGKAQERFEDSCQHDFYCETCDAYIDVEDGLKSDDGDWSINVLLCDDRSTLSERLYSFRKDGVYDDMDNFVGDTVDELVDNIAASFAEDYSDLQ